jgi:DNA-binding PadR family transcriptional regulator
MASTPRRSTLDDHARAALPLTPIALHILLALADRRRHGLGIAEHIEEFTSGRLTLGPGTLYSTIKRLLDGGLIDDAESNPDEESVDPRRRYYHITPLGRRALEIETRELSNVLDVARLKRVIR